MCQPLGKIMARVMLLNLIVMMKNQLKSQINQKTKNCLSPKNWLNQKKNR